MRTKAISILILAWSLSACATTPNASSDAVEWHGAPDPSFSAAYAEALERVERFAAAQGWGALAGPRLATRVVHFETKSALDDELIALSAGVVTEVPPTYVAMMDKRVLRTVSFAAYKRVHPGHSREDYVKILVHELAHQLHVDVLDGDEERMGPVWFFEGFAVVAADQYTDAEVPSPEAIQDMLTSGTRGDYRAYGAVLRMFAKRRPLPELVRAAADEPESFLPWWQAWGRGERKPL